MEDEVFIPPSRSIPSGWRGSFWEVESFEPNPNPPFGCARCKAETKLYVIMAGNRRFDRCRNCMGELWNLRVKYGMEW